MVHYGDCRDSMRALIADGVKVQCVVTSPPYWGLRDYGHAGQIGLEPTPELYVAAMVDTFRLARDLLADDGVLWLNLGDSYATGAGKVGDHPGSGAQGAAWRGSRGGHEGKHGYSEGARGTDATTQPNRMPQSGLKPKDLVGIPWRVAFALQADGWYLRQDIIWAKPNPMPESVTDRCTKSHEYLFLLSKSERYFYDHEAIKEPVTLSTIDRLSQPNLEHQAGSDLVPGKNNGNMKAVGHIPGNKTHRGATAYANGDESHRTKGGLVGYAERQRSKRDSFKRDAGKGDPEVPGQSATQHRPDRDESDYDIGTRNKRSVWTVATQPYSGAHFATFPPALIEPCILAGSRPGDIVLDPFLGSGTVGQVASQLGRKWIGCELNEKDYGPLIERRTAQGGMELHPTEAA